MLVKDPKYRITLKQLLEDPWLCRGEELSKLRKNCTEEDSFKYYSLEHPRSLKIYDEVQKRTVPSTPKKGT